MLDLNRQNLDAILAMNKQHLASREASDAAWRESALRTVDRLAPYAAQAVAPVGPSSGTVEFGVGASDLTVVDEAMAETIRNREDLELSDLIEMTLRTDGFSHHGKTLKVEHPEIPGRFINAGVKDPIFDALPNPYTEAASECATITVRAKKGVREGRIERLYIMDFLGRVA